MGSFAPSHCGMPARSLGNPLVEDPFAVSRDARLELANPNVSFRVSIGRFTHWLHRCPMVAKRIFDPVAYKETSKRGGQGPCVAILEYCRDRRVAGVDKIPRIFEQSRACLSSCMGFSSLYPSRI